ncbi:MAG: 3-deoxy-manno-octulosonate cytidylyltransferase [Bradymonadia bacterium]
MSPEHPHSTDTVAIIPARLRARRLQDKPLQNLVGEPLVWRVYRQVARCAEIDAVWVAADHPTIVDAVQSRGGNALLVPQTCHSGTERVALANLKIGAQRVINVQGDEPFVGSDLLRPLVNALAEGHPIATLGAPLPERALHDPHAVKVVSDPEGRALYFSRAPIPGRLHVGLYGFDAEVLQTVAHLPRSPLARIEDLEQLTWLEARWPIHVAAAPRATLSIDTPADLAEARARLTGQRPIHRAERP